MAAAAATPAAAPTAPRIWLTHSCRDGFGATLSNISGVGHVDFRVHVTTADHHARTEHVGVRPGQALRRWFAVGRGEAATITVTAAGAGTRSLHWSGHCG